MYLSQYTVRVMLAHYYYPQTYYLENMPLLLLKTIIAVVWIVSSKCYSPKVKRKMRPLLHQRIASFIFTNTASLLMIPHLFFIYYHTLSSLLTIFLHSLNTICPSHLHSFSTFILFFSFIKALAAKTNCVWPADPAYPPLHCLLYWRNTPEGDWILWIFSVTIPYNHILWELWRFSNWTQVYQIVRRT